MRCGLFSLKTGKSVPLKDVNVSVTIGAAIGHVESVLTYSNDGIEPVETVFTFPLDDLSAVYRFEAEIDGKVIIAECQEKEQARETYNDAMEAGHTAFLLEESSESSDIFRCRLGNLPPLKTATLKICYVTELGSEPGGWLVYTLPTVLRPRYTPEGFQHDMYRDPFAGFGVQAASDVCTNSKPYSMTFKVDIQSRNKIREVKSISDQVDIVYSDYNTRATISKTWLMDQPVDHDLSIHIAYEDANQPQAIVERGMSNGTGVLKFDALTLSFYPDLGTEMTSSGEYIFVIDRSGSMRGERIHNAKQTLLLLLKSLPVGCYFNIVSFGTSHSVLFDRMSEVYSENNLARALQLQQTMNADMGGTEILRPLQEIYLKSTIPDHPRQIFLLTDGQVSNTKEVIDLVGKNASNSRVFAVGIGEGASTSLVKGVARAGRGKAVFVKGTDRLQEKVMSLLKCAMQPAVRNLSVDWQLPRGVGVTNIPETPPPVYNGEKTVLYALLSGSENLVSFDGRLKLSGEVQEKRFEYSLDFSEKSELQPTESPLPIHRLAAKAQIKELEDKEFLSNTGESEKTKIVALSLAANIASRHTSFVGVDKDSKVKLKEPTYSSGMMGGSLFGSGFISSGAPKVMFRGMGGGGFGGGFGSGAGFSFGSAPPGGPPPALPVQACASFGAPPPPPPAACFGSPAPPFSKSSGAIFGSSAVHPPTIKGGGFFGSSAASNLSFTAHAMPHSSFNSGNSGDDMMRLIALQTFVGSWNLTDELCQILGRKTEELRAGAPCENLEIWATCLAVVWLSKKHGNRKAEWDMIASKARGWLQGNAGNLSLETVLEAAKTFV